MRRVLICSPDRPLQTVRAELLARAGFEVGTPATAEQGIAEIRTGRFDVLVVCSQIDDELADRMMQQFRAANPAGRVIAIQATPWQKRSGADIFVDTHSPQALVAAVLSVAVTIPWQHERRLLYEASDQWSGWFCSRCCWNRPEPASETERTILAGKIHAEFNAHHCESFARENWRLA